MKHYFDKIRSYFINTPDNSQHSEVPPESKVKSSLQHVYEVTSNNKCLKGIKQRHRQIEISFYQVTDNQICISPSMSLCKHIDGPYLRQEILTWCLMF